MNNNNLLIFFLLFFYISNSFHYVSYPKFIHSAKIYSYIYVTIIAVQELPAFIYVCITFTFSCTCTKSLPPFIFIHKRLPKFKCILKCYFFPSPTSLFYFYLLISITFHNPVYAYPPIVNTIIIVLETTLDITLRIVLSPEHGIGLGEVLKLSVELLESTLYWLCSFYWCIQH